MAHRSLRTVRFLLEFCLAIAVQRKTDDVQCTLNVSIKMNSLFFYFRERNSNRINGGNIV